MRQGCKYDSVYAADAQALGEPNDMLLKFFKTLPEHLHVLDLGAGQGRDALPLARAGHRVTAVDVSTIGLEQLAADAKRENLPISCIHADLDQYCPDQEIDLLLLDRTLHMLTPASRQALLLRCLPWLTARAHIAIIDEPRHMSSYLKTLEAAASWDVLVRQKGFLFLRLRA